MRVSDVLVKSRVNVLCFLSCVDVVMRESWQSRCAAFGQVLITLVGLSYLISAWVAPKLPASARVMYCWSLRLSLARVSFF